MAPPVPSTAHLDRVNYLFGYPIAHSLSPLLHQTVYDNLGLRWGQIPLESRDMDHFLTLVQDPKFFGASVTMPHKVAIIPKLDEITPEGKAIGACNTIFVREGDDGRRIYCGTNTDCVGIQKAFERNVRDGDAVYRGRPGMVIGGGGAARSAVYALKKWLGCSPIYIVNRDKAEVEAVIEACSRTGFGDGVLHVESAAQARRLEGPGAIVACIPNLPPRTSAERAAREVMEIMLTKRHKGAILEMCYHPSPWTAIAEISQKAGWQVILGTEAMIWQGLEQDRYWTGRKVEQLPVEKVKAVVGAALNKSVL